MSVFDLLFIAVFLAFVGSTAVAAVQALRGRHATALRLVKTTLLCAAGYLAVVAAVALTAPQHIIRMGEDRCFDDWCIAVTQVEVQPAIASLVYDVTLRVSSRARRVRPSAPDVRVYLVDEQGRTYGSYQDPGAPRLGVMLHPLEAVTTRCRFRVPADNSHLALVVAHGGGPGWFIIGDDQNPLHKKTIVPMPAAPPRPGLQ